MRRRSGLWACCLLMLGLAGRAWGGEPEWVEVRSPHFSVVTDAGEKRGREVALRFEQMRAVFGALMTKAKVTLAVPLQIVAFRNTKEMRQFVPLWKGKPTEVSGLFLSNDDRSFILLDLSAEDPWQVVFHEYAHQSLNGNTNGELQPWFDEGFAEYFATIKINGKEAAVGLPSPSNAEIVLHNSLMKTADLFRVPHNSSIYNEGGDHRSLFYAQSWLVVHFLYDTQLMPQVFNYFDLVKQRGMPVEEAIKQALGMSATDFDNRVRQYLSAGRIAYNRIPTPAGIESTGYSVKTLATPDSKAVLADMHLHSPDYQEKAIGEFEEVLKLQPDHPAALRGLGYAYLTKQDYHHAGEYFRRAAAHDSTDPRVLYYSVLLIQQEEGPALGNDREELAVIQKYLEKSVTLDPEFADAYSLLAFTYMSQGKNEEALPVMLKAVALNPRSEAYSFNLSQIYVVNHKYDEAIALLQQLSRSPDPQLAAKAAQSLPMAQNAKQAAATGVPVRIQSGPMPAVNALDESAAQTSVVETAAAAKPEPAKPEPAKPEPAKPEPAPDSGPIRFLKGKLVEVDCSSAPAAILTVMSGANTWKLHARDSTRVIVIGADKFSCDWVNQKIAVNYHQTGAGAGEVVSVELQ